MERIKAWLRESVHRPLAIGAALAVAAILILLGSVTAISAIQTATSQAQQDAEAQQEEQQQEDSTPSDDYTEPPPIVTLSDFYSKKYQTASSRELNKVLYALTDTIVAPNKPATVKGNEAIAWGSFGDLCGVLVSHFKSDSSDIYNISVYPYAGEQQVSSKSALDIGPSNQTIQQDGTYEPSFTREHASIKGMNYVLTQALKKCTDQPVVAQPVPDRGGY